MMNEYKSVGLSILLIIIISFMLTYGWEDSVTGDSITGKVVEVEEGNGCCEVRCSVTGDNECPSRFFHENKSCVDVEECNVGCCIDREGYCYTNYVKSLCEREGKEFIGGRECHNYEECFFPPDYPADQKGYRYTKDDIVHEVRPSPERGSIGDGFKIEAFLQKKEDLVEINVSSTDPNYSRIKRVYDDGLGQDLYKEDDVYTTGWLSGEEYTDIDNFTMIDLQTKIDGKPRGEKGEILLSPTSCLPLSSDWRDDENETNIIFAKRNDLKFPLKYRIDALMSRLIENETLRNESYDLYYINEKMSPSRAKEECPFDLGNNSLVVVLDKNESGCRQDGNLVNINQYPTPSPTEIRRPSAIKDNFCKFFSSPNGTMNDYLGRYERPSVKIHSPENGSKITTPLTEFSFTAKDNQSTYLRYKIYLDSDDKMLDWGYMKANKTIKKNLSLQDGRHQLYVKVQDLHLNKWGDRVFLDINVSNFIVHSSLEEEMNTTKNFTFTFNYSHEIHNNLNYTVYNEIGAVKEGSLLKDKNKQINLTLSPGSHPIKVVVRDPTGRKASSIVSDVNVLPEGSPGLNSITGNVVKSIKSSPEEENSMQSITGRSPTVHGPFPGSPKQGWNESPSDNVSKYLEVDETGLYEPALLCGGGEDTGVRYRPANCMGFFGTNISITPKLKDREGERYYYEYEYTALVCKDNIFVDAYLENNEGKKEEISSRVVDTGYELVDEDTVESFGNFSMICVYSSINGSSKKCVPFEPAACADGKDNDNDGLIDMEDPGCEDRYDRHEGDATSECQDDVDNDGDGLIDEEDPACHVDGDLNKDYVKRHNNESTATTQCQDYRDNDGDGVCDYDGCVIDGVSYPPDPGCDNRTDDYEGDGTTECQDGKDNDGNGRTDYPQDYGCTSPIDNKEEPTACNDGKDNDDDGYIDYPEDLGCPTARNDSESFPIRVCDAYNHTVIRDKSEREFVNESDEPFFRYHLDYEIHACDEARAVSSYLMNNKGERERIKGEYLEFLGHSTTQEILNSTKNFTQICHNSPDIEITNECRNIKKYKKEGG